MPKTDIATTAQAILPQQDRGHRRFEAVLREAEKLLLEEGLEGFSIPVLAERLEFTRRSIYKFFPSPYAILNELTLRYLNELSEKLLAEAEDLLTLSLTGTVERIAYIGSRFYNARPVARLLILGGPVTDSSFRAQSVVVQSMGDWTREYLKLRGVELPNSPPDVASLAVEICLASFRLSYLRHGKITTAYRDEAALAMKAYISRYLT